jgi:hypothetical protein
MLPAAGAHALATGRAELRCGTANVGDNADFTLFVGASGFPAQTLMQEILEPEHFSLGSSTTDAQGSFGNSYAFGYNEGFVGSPFSASPFTLASGSHNITYSDAAGDTAVAPFTVPTSCPPFGLSLYSLQGQDRAARNQAFLVAINSSPSFDATTRIDRNTFRAFLDDNTNLPLSCFSTADVNNDGLSDLLCYSYISQTSAQLPAGNYTLHVLGRTTDEGTSPGGFLYIKNDNFQLVN